MPSWTNRQPPYAEWGTGVGTLRPAAPPVRGFRAGAAWSADVASERCRRALPIGVSNGRRQRRGLSAGLPIRSAALSQTLGRNAVPGPLRLKR